MNILAIDTSGPVAGCAVMAEGKIVHTVSMQHGLTHSETILPEVERAMEASGLKCGDIDVFAAVAGPGLIYRRAHRRLHGEGNGACGK